MIKLYRHVTLSVWTEIHRWTPKSGATWFSGTITNKLSYKLCSLFNYRASYSDITLQWLDDGEQMWMDLPVNCWRYYPSVYLEWLRRQGKKHVRIVGTPGKILIEYQWIQVRITTTSDNLLYYVLSILHSYLLSFKKVYSTLQFHQFLSVLPQESTQPHWNKNSLCFSISLRHANLLSINCDMEILISAISLCTDQHRLCPLSLPD